MSNFRKELRDGYQYFHLPKVNGKGVYFTRLYIGPVIRPLLSLHEWRIKKLKYTFLGLLYFILLITGGLPDIPVNHSYLLLIPMIASAFTGLYCIFGILSFLTSGYDMTHMEFHGYSDRIQIGSCISAITCCISSIIVIIFTIVTFSSQNYTLCNLLSSFAVAFLLLLGGLCMILLFFFEKRSDYETIPALYDDERLLSSIDTLADYNHILSENIKRLGTDSRFTKNLRLPHK